MKKLVVLFLGFISIVAVSLIFTPNAFAVPETVVVRQTYLLDDTNQTVLPDQTVAPGATFNPATDPGEGYTFAYYIVNGVISDALEGAPFIVGSYLNLVAVYKPAGKFAVVFVDVSGEIIKHNDKLAQYVVSGQDATAPVNLPSKKNYIVSPTNPWSDSFLVVTEDKVIKLQYELSTTATFDITLNSGTPLVANYNDIVTLTSETDVLWIEDGRSVWYGMSYSFSALGDRDITTEAGNAPTEPIVTMNEIIDLRADHRSFLAQVYVPSGDLLEAGFLRGTEHEVTFANKSNHIASSLVPETNEFIVSIPNTITDNIRAYALVDDVTIIEAYSFVEPEVELLKLPTPVNGFNHTPSTNHVGIGPYPATDGYDGKLRFVWFDKDTQEVVSTDLFNAPANVGYAYIYTNFLTTLPAGTYTVRFQAVGDQVLALDSEFYPQAFEVTKEEPQLDSITLTLNGELITWNNIVNADIYEIYLNEELVPFADTTETSYLIDPVALGLSYGEHTFTVVARAVGYQDSEDSVVYEYIDESAQQLDAPTNVELSGDIVSWSAVINASGYRVIINEQNNNLDDETLDFDLSTLDLPNGTYSVQVMALGNGIEYLHSVSVATEEDYVVESALTPLAALTAGDLAGEGGGLVNTYSGGHRNIVWHAFVSSTASGRLNQNGNASGIRLTVYESDGVTYLGETIITVSGTTFHVPSGGFAGLLTTGRIIHLQVRPSAQGTTNGFTYSAPLIYTLKA